MATRNERRRKAKARELELRSAVANALRVEAERPETELERLKREYPTNDEVHPWSKNIGFTKRIFSTKGRLVAGKVLSPIDKAPYQRRLIYDASQDRQIEKRRRVV